LPSSIIACVIVRMKSTRLKRKALLDLNGNTILEQLIRRLRLAKSIDRIVLCTSSNKEDTILLNKAKEYGVDAYAGDEEDVLSRLIDVAKIYNAKAVIRVTGDNPFTDHSNIDQLVKKFLETGAEYLRTNRLPLGVTAEIMERRFLTKLHKSMEDPRQSEYMSFYSFNPDLYHCEVLFPPEYLDRPYYSLTIDYQDELDLARKIYSHCKSKDGIPRLKDVIEFLDSDESYMPVDKMKEIKLPNNETMYYKNLIDLLDKLAKKIK